MDSTQYILDIIKLHQKGWEAIIIPPINDLNIQNNSKIQNNGNKAKKKCIKRNKKDWKKECAMPRNRTQDTEMK